MSIITTIREWLVRLYEEHPKKAAFIAVLILVHVLRRAMRRRKSVAKQVVLITGGASGIGKNLARRFATAGAQVVLWDLNERALAAAGKQIAQEDAGLAWTYVCDVTDRQAVYQTAARVMREVGKVDILINNAGIVSGGLLTDISDDKIERTFKVNTLAHFWTAKAFLPEMIRTNSGHIVTIASAAGLGGVSRLTDYCASKFAANGFDEALRVELKSRGLTGVKTTCICPYYINTGMFDGVKTRFSFLLPILSEEYASRKIYEAILYEDSWMCMPRLLYLQPLLRFLLPIGAFDWVSNFLGINQSMDEFKGRH